MKIRQKHVTVQARKLHLAENRTRLSTYIVKSKSDMINFVLKLSTDFPRILNRNG